MKLKKGRIHHEEYERDIRKIEQHYGRKADEIQFNSDHLNNKNRIDNIDPTFSRVADQNVNHQKNQPEFKQEYEYKRNISPDTHIGSPNVPSKQGQ